MFVNGASEVFALFGALNGGFSIFLSVRRRTGWAVVYLGIGLAYLVLSWVAR